MMLPRNLAVIRAVLLLILLQTERPFVQSLSAATSRINDDSPLEPAARNDQKSAATDLESMPSHELKERFSLGTKLNSSLLLRSLVKRDSDDEKPERSEFLKSNATLSKFGRSMNSTAPVPFKRHEVYTYIIYFSRVLYALVCVVGLCGNSLVIYVVLRFSKMQTVTNLYILNLALADEMFLFGLPFLIITMYNSYWAFGYIMCKIYMTLTSINQFTSSLLLTVMSADRYIAVCHPISSPRYRTPCIAKVICLSVWTLSAYLMVPIFIFSDVQLAGDKLSCNIYWPEMYDNFKGQRAFTIYSFTLGFFIPLILILLFYFLVICKLRTISTKHKSREKKKTQKKVTYLVLVVISVYICCWLPYWITQIYITFEPPATTPQSEFSFTVAVMLLSGCLSYANSAVNPILYAFLSENFKKSFQKAFTCAANIDVNNQLHGENSVFPQQHHLSKNKKQHSSSSKAETASTYLDSNQKIVKKDTKSAAAKGKLKDAKKLHQITNNLSGKVHLRKPNKRLSLDLSNGQCLKNPLSDEELNRPANEFDDYHFEHNGEQSKGKCINNKLKLIKLATKEAPFESKLNGVQPIGEATGNRCEPGSGGRLKRRRRSEPNDQTAGQTKNRRRSTLISQEGDPESAKVDEETSSELDDEELAYESEEYEEEEDSSLTSQEKEANCVAMMPARFKAKFLSGSGSSKSRLRTPTRKPTSLKRTNSSGSLEEGRTNSRKISLLSRDSENSQQMKKSNKNKLLALMMNKLASKQAKERQEAAEKRPTGTRISKKRISTAEAQHHLYGNLRRMNKANSQFDCPTAGEPSDECECENDAGPAGADAAHHRCESRLNKLNKPTNEQCLDCFKSDSNLNNLHSIERAGSGSLKINKQDSSVRSKTNANHRLPEPRNGNDNNNNYDAEGNRLLGHETAGSAAVGATAAGGPDGKHCESIECAQCLEKRGVIQTQL